MAKPELKYKYALEGNPFGEKIIVNVAEVVSWMYDKFPGNKEKVPTPKFITEGKTLCEKQIVNLTEIVQWMYDNWRGVKGDTTHPAPVLAYATEGVKPFGVLFIENISEVVAEMFGQMTETLYTKVTAEEKVAGPVAGYKYFVLEDGKFVPGGLVGTEDWVQGDVYYIIPTYKYTKVDKTVVTEPAVNTQYWVVADGVYVLGGTNTDGDEWLDDVDVYTRSIVWAD